MLKKLKQQTRKDMLLKRSFFAQKNGIKASSIIKSVILENLLEKNKVFSLYYPIKDEVDITSLMFNIYDNNSIACLPVIKNKGEALVFAKWTPDSILTAKKWGILEPLKVEELIPDIMLIPLVAFDRTGTRLGYGGGYYDKTIVLIKKQKPNVQLVGIGYAMQECEQLPFEDGDQKLNAVITEKEFIKF